MKRYLTPTWTLNSVYDINSDDLLAQGIEGVIIDLDNTLIAWNQWEHTPEMAHWLHELKDAGIKVHIASNNNPGRVKKAADPLAAAYTARALKPLRRKLRKVIEQLGMPADRIVLVGDQLMTDIIGANRLGLRSILVKPIVQHDNIYTWFNRRLEREAMRHLGLDRQADWGNTLGGD